jgi:hypothetical protein
MPQYPYDFSGVMLSDEEIQTRIRRRVAGDLEKMSHTVGSPHWLASLTDEEFGVVAAEILPAVIGAMNLRLLR